MESWDKINAVKRMQDYIDENINKEITLVALAKEAGYSVWHAGRVFKELTGKTPFDYIRVLRLSQAALRLKENKERIVDVAFDFVFDSHEGFTRAFSKEFGISPKNYSKNKPDLRIFMPARIKEYYISRRKGEDCMPEKSKSQTVFVQVVERPARKLLLKRGVKATHYFEYCEEVGCDVWDVLTSIKDTLYEPIGMWLPENLRTPNTSQYAQGVELPLDFDGEIPSGFDLIDLPPCKMMIFQSQPFKDEEFEEAINDLWEVMDSYNPEIYGFKWADEDGPRFQMEPVGYRGYIEGRPVKALRP